MKSRVNEADLVVKRLKEQIERLKEWKVGSHNFELRKLLQKILKGEEPVRTDGDRELGSFY